MSVKKNIGWNMLLTLSAYVFPLLTFPYVTRVLGPEGFGMANFALSVVDYAVLLSTLGMTLVGIRSVAQCPPSREERSKVFSHLVSVHLIFSFAALLIYFIVVWFIPPLSFNKELYFIGAAKILFNVFLVEWLYQGLQDFRYVTLRTLFVRTAYVAAIFLFVRHKEDYDIFFYITIAQVVLNSIINWRYSRKYVRFTFYWHGNKEHLSPVVSMGVNSVLLSFYTTFNVLFLGFCCGDEPVGYYSAAVKLYGLILSVISAYNGVFVPYMNTLYANGEIDKFRQVVSKSISLVCMVSLPIIVGGTILAPQIIRLVAGAGFERAVLPFRIVLIQVLLVGIAQILECQILLAYKKYREILICTAATTAMAAFIIIIYVPTHAEVAAAWAVALPHILELILLWIYTQRVIKINVNKRRLQSYVISCVPVAAICIVLFLSSWHFLWILFVGIIASMTIYIILLFVYKEPLLQELGVQLKKHHL